jgi:hypothetical protein
MKTLSSTPVVDEYLDNADTVSILGKYEVKVKTYSKSSSSGTWATGFKFSDNTYGYLVRTLRGTNYYKPSRYSADHGVTWYDTLMEATKQRGGKVNISSIKSKEFAYDAIQKINSEYAY